MSTTVTIDPRFHDAVIFDLDGVVTDTASIHAAAWAAMFNDFLQRRQASDDEDHSPFTDDDYRHFVDGKARGDGVTDFLASRGISLPPGSATDSTEVTISGLGERKQEIFLETLHAGVPVFESTVVLVRKLADTGVAVGVYSSSRNCERILKDAGLGDLFSVRVDGVAAQDLGLPGKPDPAVLLEATRRLGAVPERSVVIEDAEAGVEAGSRGGFALVIGVDRTGHAEELRRHGADVVVPDLADVAVRKGDKQMCRRMFVAFHDGVISQFEGYDNLAELDCSVNLVQRCFTGLETRVAVSCCRRIGRKPRRLVRARAGGPRSRAYGLTGLPPNSPIRAAFPRNRHGRGCRRRPVGPPPNAR